MGVLGDRGSVDGAGLTQATHGRLVADINLSRNCNDPQLQRPATATTTESEHFVATANPHSDQGG